MIPNSETYNIGCYKELFIVMIDYIIGKRVATQICEYCDEPKQNFAHLMHLCPFIQGLWLQIIQHFNENTQIKIERSAVKLDIEQYY